MWPCGIRRTISRFTSIPPTRPGRRQRRFTRSLTARRARGGLLHGLPHGHDRAPTGPAGGTTPHGCRLADDPVLRVLHGAAGLAICRRGGPPDLAAGAPGHHHRHGPVWAAGPAAAMDDGSEPRGAALWALRGRVLRHGVRSLG